MELASEGARIPFFTSTPSKAATLASPVVVAKLTLGLGLGLGLGLEFGSGFALAAALLVFAAFAVFASLFAAIRGTAAMAKIIRFDNHFLGINMDFAFNIEWWLLRSRIISAHGAQSCVVSEKDAVMPITH
jgi:hypothetical protein